MHSNYTGPSALNNAFHAAPHISVVSDSFRTFEVNPANVKANPTQYLESAMFMPVIVFLIGVLIMLAAFIAQCCRCDCSKPTRRCCNCPKLLRMDTENPCADTTSKCHFVWVILIGSLVVATAIAGISVQYTLASSVVEVTDVAMEIKDDQDQMRAQLEVINTQTSVVAASSNQLLLLVRNAAPALPSLVQTSAQFAASSMSAASIKTSEALQQADVDLAIKSVVDQTRRAVMWFRIIAALLFVATCGLLAGSMASTFAGPRHEPFRPCQDASESFQVIQFFIVLMIGVTPIMLLAIVGGDLCQNPNAYLNEVAPNNQYTEFYINCPPGAASPVQQDLEAARASVQEAQSAVQLILDYLQANPSPAYPEIQQQCVLTVSGTTSAVEEIDLAIANSGCYDQHARLVSIETKLCGESFNLLAATLFVLCGYISLPLLLNCILPRKSIKSYKPVNSR